MQACAKVAATIITGRMIKNSGLAILGLVVMAGCARARADTKEEERFQGVAELDERQLAFEVSGRLLELRAREGDRVARGAVVASIDGALEEQARAARDLEAQAAQAQAELVNKGARPEEIASMQARVRAAQATVDLLQKQVDRERTLHERGVTPTVRLEELEGQLSRATAEREALESALRDLGRGARKEEKQAAARRAEAARATVALDDLRIGRRELHAPLDALVLDVHAEPGEVVAAGAPVLTVADPQRIHADIFVAQGRLGGVDVGDRVRAQADGVPGVLQGSVEHISRRTEFTPRFLFSERERPNLVVRVRVRLDDPKQLLHAGVPVFVAIDRDVRVAAPAGSAR
jgi:HlyD family secretion protein